MQSSVGGDDCGDSNASGRGRSGSGDGGSDGGGGRYVFSSRATSDRAWEDVSGTGDLGYHASASYEQPSGSGGGGGGPSSAPPSPGPSPTPGPLPISRARRNCERVVEWLTVYDWLLVAVIGICVALSVARNVYHSEESVFHAMVTDDCNARARIISQAGENVIDTTRALVGFFAHAPTATVENFNHYSQVFGVGSRQKIMVSYLERVKPFDRRRWERDASTTYNRSVKIYELPNARDVFLYPAAVAAMGGSNEPQLLATLLPPPTIIKHPPVPVPVPVQPLNINTGSTPLPPTIQHKGAAAGGSLQPDRDAYPVKMIYPVIPGLSELYYGADLMSDPPQASGFQHAIETGESSFSAPPENATSFHWLSHYIIVYNSSLPTATPADRRIAACGLMAGTVNVSRFLIHALAAAYRPLQMHIQVSDVEDVVRAAQNKYPYAYPPPQSHLLYDSDWEMEENDSNSTSPTGSGATSSSSSTSSGSGGGRRTSRDAVDPARSRNITFNHLGRQWVMTCAPLRSFSRVRVGSR